MKKAPHAHRFPYQISHYGKEKSESTISLLVALKILETLCAVSRP